jgi:hypothetical protein
MMILFPLPQSGSLEQLHFTSTSFGIFLSYQLFISVRSSAVSSHLLTLSKPVPRAFQQNMYYVPSGVTRSNIHDENGN